MNNIQIAPGLLQHLRSCSHATQAKIFLIGTKEENGIFTEVRELPKDGGCEVVPGTVGLRVTQNAISLFRDGCVQLMYVYVPSREFVNLEKLLARPNQDEIDVANIKGLRSHCHVDEVIMVYPDRINYGRPKDI